ncbi:MAG: tol-pal system-associated acyl-CoA thioesterase [Chromatiaceae bacterium]
MNFAAQTHSEQDDSVPTFSWPIRVYYEDTDAGGVVYYANYLRFFERARTEWLRALGFEQTKLVGRSAIVFAVRRAEVDYLKPARLDDDLSVASEVALNGRTRLNFDQRLLRGDTLLSTARIQVVCLHSGNLRPAAIPMDLRERIDAQQ